MHETDIDIEDDGVRIDVRRNTLRFRLKLVWSLLWHGRVLMKADHMNWIVK